MTFRRGFVLKAALVTLLSGGYLLLFWLASQQIAYFELREPVRYWLVFPYAHTAWLARLMTLAFMAGSFALLTALLAKRRPAWFWQGIRWGIPLLAALGMAFMQLLFAFDPVMHLDSLTLGAYRYHLVYKNNAEYPPMYYLVACRRLTLYCEEVARFPPGEHIVSSGAAQEARLQGVDAERLRVVDYNWVIFVYPPPDE